MQLSTISPFLSREAVAIFNGVAPKKWVKTAKNIGHNYLAELIHALAQIDRSKEAERIGKKARNAIDKEALSGSVRTTYEEGKKALKKKQVLHINRDPRALKNVGATCWMNVLLQHLRITNDFDMMLQNAPQNDAGLHQALSIVVRAMKEGKVISEDHLKELQAKFKEANIPPENSAHHDASEVLTLLQTRFGNSRGEMEFSCYSYPADGSAPTVRAEEPSRYMTLKCLENGDTSTKMLRELMGRHRPIGAAQEIEYKFTNQPRFLHFVVNRPEKRDLNPDEYTKLEAALLSEKKEAHAKVDALFDALLLLIKDGEKHRLQKENWKDAIAPKIESTSEITKSLAPTLATLKNFNAKDVVIKPSANASIERVIDIGPHSHDGVSKRYELQGVICRSGENKHNSGGHFWYLRKAGAQWMKYNDMEVTSPTEAEVQEMLDRHAFSLFYYPI